MNKHVLIGAELEGSDAHSNFQRTSEMRLELIKLGLSFVGVNNISAKNKAHLFLVSNADESVMASLAKRYGQKAILSTDAAGNTEVVSTKSKGRTPLGKFVAVNKDAAESSKFYLTFVEDGKEYFYVTKKGDVCDKSN